MYFFKPALIQDTAYQPLFKSSRRELHETTARALEEQFPERTDAEPKVIARARLLVRITSRAVPPRQKAP